MYTRKVNGKEIELRSSGALYKDALVMFDRETGTLWTQVDGAALRGALAGHRLEAIPAMRTSWKTWKQLHPDTLVLRKPQGIWNSNYDKYSSDPTQCGATGTKGDGRMNGKALVVGIDLRGTSAAVPVEALEKKPLVQFELAGEPLVAFYSAEDQTPVVFRAKIGTQRLTFRLRTHQQQVLLEDAETRSRWLPLEGRAVEGPLAGSKLEPVLHTLSYWYAWSSYRPKTLVVPQP